MKEVVSFELRLETLRIVLKKVIERIRKEVNQRLEARYLFYNGKENTNYEDLTPEPSNGPSPFRKTPKYNDNDD